MNTCPIDEYNYSTDRLDNLDRHLRREHEYDDDSILALRDKRKKEKAASRLLDVDTRKFLCPSCPLRFISKPSLSHHIRQKHPDPDNPIVVSKNVRCPIEDCSMGGLRSREELADHCRIEHSDMGEFEIVERIFSSMEEMEKWKHQMESSSTAAFTKDSNQGCRHYYWCNRGNKKRTHDSEINRNSSRVQSHCSAFINVTLRSDGSVVVKACLDHIKHELDPACLPLNPSQREDLAVILTQGFTVAKTKEKLREYGELHPFFWISSERAVRKLLSTRQEKPWEKESDDHLSLEKRFEEERSESGIRLLRTTPSEFALGEIGTYGSLSDCRHSAPTRMAPEIRSSRDLTGRHIQHLKMAIQVDYMVLDEKDRGLPAAFLLSSHTTLEEVFTLFKCIQDLLPKFDTEWVMSDDAPAFFNGYKRCFPKTRAEPLHCQWHVIKNLKQYALDLYGSKDERGKTVATSARNVARTIQRVEFWQKATSLLSDLDTDRDEDKKYAKYFEKYLKSFSLWAPFMRVHAPFNTTMISESFHSKLKMSVLGDNTLSRIDRLAHILITLPTDIGEELRIADRKKYVSGVFRLQAQMAAHKKGVNYGNNGPTVTRDGASNWKMQSEKKDGKSYTVRDHGEEYCTCEAKNLHCIRCGVCPRRFTCNCPEGNRPGTNCKHTHWAIISSNKDDADVPATSDPIELGAALDREHDYWDLPPLQPIPEDATPEQFRDDGIDEEEREKRKKEKEEEDRKKDEKSKFRNLCLEALNKTTSTVTRIYKDDDDETQLRILYEGLTEVLARVNIGVNDAAVRGERIKKRQGQRGQSLLNRETRGMIKKRKRDEMKRPIGFDQRPPEEISICGYCRKSVPPTEETEDGNDTWVACSNELCGLFYHEFCCPLETHCMACRNGIMIYKEIE